MHTVLGDYVAQFYQMYFCRGVVFQLCRPAGHPVVDVQSQLYVAIVADSSVIDFSVYLPPSVQRLHCEILYS